MNKFIKFDGRIFAVDEIAFVGLSHDVQTDKWPVHIIMKCGPSHLMEIGEFSTEKDAQEYLCAVMNALTK